MVGDPLSLDAFLARRGADRRLARLTHDLPLPEAVGLEFGPGDRPTALPEGVRVAYVDRNPDANAGLPGAPPIDHAWTGAGSLAAALGDRQAPKGFDFAIAAGVAQFVPNLLGWLRGIHAVLRPGGVFNLSLPDRRFMRDVGRSRSTTAELVEADLLGLTRPNPRQRFAHLFESRIVSTDGIWAGETTATAPRMAGPEALAEAYARTRDALLSDADEPCHCWVFTPRVFLDLVADATRLGRFPYVLNNVSSTEPGKSEFFVSMRRDVQEEPDALRGLQEAALGHLRGVLDRQARNAAQIARP
ncbi:methyltransferase domain-containing protein [Methylobacterium sp. J-068]|uniref:methyltransferase domain-containing protein n=1 Tax=Methylobacterium sp. J-068 TaxID=2836649 RepID=UPI001FBA6255|nr:methyltransferase domain-containing protein [Methylobacterium sp. J-068]MCJ2034842.1 class I SAM-dependent methyltransferase [Methylobacterium sp. J-068]